MPCTTITIKEPEPSLKITNIRTIIKDKQEGKIGLPVQIIINIEGTGKGNILMSYSGEKETIVATVVKSPYEFSFVRYFVRGNYTICAELIQ